MLDLSQWIFLKYQIFIIFFNRLLKIFMFKIVHSHTCQNQLGQIRYSRWMEEMLVRNNDLPIVELMISLKE